VFGLAFILWSWGCEFARDSVDPGTFRASVLGSTLDTDFAGSASFRRIAEGGYGCVIALRAEGTADAVYINFDGVLVPGTYELDLDIAPDTNPYYNAVYCAGECPNDVNWVGNGGRMAVRHASLSALEATLNLRIHRPSFGGAGLSAQLTGRLFALPDSALSTANVIPRTGGSATCDFEVVPP
jgi:hypothetical protein